MSAVDWHQFVSSIVKEQIGKGDTDLQYHDPYPDSVAQYPFPHGFKNIVFTTFSGETKEDAATHMASSKVQCGQYVNNNILKLKLFGISLSGAAFSWYPRLKPGSIADWPTMERLFRETYGTIEPEVGLDSLTQMKQQSM